MNIQKSIEAFKRAKNAIAGGVNSPVRAYSSVDSTPLFIDRGKGSKVWDIDGNEYIDCSCNNGATILGHGDKDVNSSVKEILDSGLTCTLESELSLTVAKQLQNMVPSAEQVRFANTGTEAVMKSIMISRAYTGRNKIIKMEGGYNGWNDDMLVSNKPDLKSSGPDAEPIAVRTAQGLSNGVTDTTIPVPFNDIENSGKIIEKHKDNIAAVIIDPVLYSCGCILPDTEYLEFLRDITEQYGIVLIFDEMITGFRLAPGGAQEYYSVTPDLAVFGKALSNGFPLSVVVGKRDLMQLTRPGGEVYYGGTYNGHQIALAAAHVALDKLKDGFVQKKMDGLCTELKNRFDHDARSLEVNAHFEHIGGKFQIYFDQYPVTDYRSAVKANKNKFKTFIRKVFSRGIYIKDNYLTHQGICYAHSEDDIIAIADAMREGLLCVVNDT